jgi:hypothetical protein
MQPSCVYTMVNFTRSLITVTTNEFYLLDFPNSVFSVFETTLSTKIWDDLEQDKIQCKNVAGKILCSPFLAGWLRGLKKAGLNFIKQPTSKIENWSSSSKVKVEYTQFSSSIWTNAPFSRLSRMCLPHSDNYRLDFTYFFHLKRISFNLAANLP